MAWLVLIVSGVPGFAYAMITGDEPFSVLKVLLVLGIVGCIF